MGIALTLKQYLDGQHAPYDVMVHERTATARACEVRAACLAKGVLLRDGRGYLLAVLPASRQLDAAALARLPHRAARPPGAPPPAGGARGPGRGGGRFPAPAPRAPPRLSVRPTGSRPSSRSGC